MKRMILSIMLLAGIGLFTSCGSNYSMIMNHNVINTQVQLASNNYRYVDKISGSSHVTYVLCIGGINRKQLYQEAYASMMDKANLKDGAKAIINVVYEEHIGGVPPFYFVRTINVSGNVIEFTR
jgi:hypothetical protein